MNENRNLARTLKEEELLVSSWWCYLGFHNWTKWKDAEQGRHTSWYTSFSRHVQYRSKYCCHCNHVNRMFVFLE